MVTWIVTTGNSDVQLKNIDHFNDISQQDDQLFSLGYEPQPLENEDIWTVPARALGLAYTDQLDDHYKDLYFPLLDSFCQGLQNKNITPDKIYFIVTDQSNIFSETDRTSDYCPYWKDSITLESIFTRYFSKKFPKSALFPIVLSPDKESKGLDHWDSTLSLVQTKLSNLNLDEAKEIYVSHQAGTPAISSALQFVSLANFGSKVKFLVGNEYEKGDADILESSKYLRGIQIQQAKSLVISGLPGAALELLKNIYEQDSDIIKTVQGLVDRFNIKYLSEGVDEDEFDPNNAIDRVRTALDLIEIYFKNENYLQGITLLTAAQETFLKAAIVKELANKSFRVSIGGSNQKRKAQELIQWTNKGLYFIDQLIDNEKKKVLDVLKFPINKIKKNKQNNYRFINDNEGLFYLLESLNSKFKNVSWKILRWLCIDKNEYEEYENDLRNQLMHNLRGVKEDEVIKFLLGNSNSTKKMTVVEAYLEYVKNPFVKALHHLSFCIHESPESPENQLQKELEKIANSLK